MTNHGWLSVASGKPFASAWDLMFGRCSATRSSKTLNGLLRFATFENSLVDNRPYHLLYIVIYIVINFSKE